MENFIAYSDERWLRLIMIIRLGEYSFWTEEWKGKSPPDSSEELGFSVLVNGLTWSLGDTCLAVEKNVDKMGNRITASLHSQWAENEKKKAGRACVQAQSVCKKDKLFPDGKDTEGNWTERQTAERYFREISLEIHGLERAAKAVHLKQRMRAGTAPRRKTYLSSTTRNSSYWCPAPCSSRIY